MFIEEVSAIVDKQTLLQIYNIATEQPFSFLYCKLNAKDKNKIFMINYEQYIEIK